MSDRKELIEKLEELRHEIWLCDIPSPTCPEYVEHHEQIQRFLKKIDTIIREEVEQLYNK